MKLNYYIGYIKYFNKTLTDSSLKKSQKIKYKNLPIEFWLEVSWLTDMSRLATLKRNVVDFNNGIFKVGILITFHFANTEVFQNYKSPCCAEYLVLRKTTLLKTEHNSIKPYNNFGTIWA